MDIQRAPPKNTGTHGYIQKIKIWRKSFMAFFQSSITALQTVVVALGAGLATWGGINLLEGYGNDNAGSKSQGIKQFMAN